METSILQILYDVTRQRFSLNLDLVFATNLIATPEVLPDRASINRRDWALVELHKFSAEPLVFKPLSHNCLKLNHILNEVRIHQE